jgi:glycerophosphoryl diester phosphodiesterase
MTTSDFLVMAHRGSMGQAPENTMAAFQLVMDQGCNAIELDIHLSKDGEIIVCHDATLDRTTDMTGYINEMTVQELKKADAGKWFHEQYVGQRLPLLEEVFDLVPPHILLNIEIKESYGRQLELKLLELLKKRNRIDSVILSSFHMKSLRFLKESEPEVKIGLIYNCNFIQHREAANLVGVPVYSLHPNFHNIDQENIVDAITHGLKVFPYTINDEKEMKEAISYGVSGIITNFPARLRSIISAE